MKRFIVIILLLAFGSHSYSQKLLIYGFNAASYPQVSAKILALDANLSPITGIDTNDIELYENGVQRTITSLKCPVINSIQPISSVLTIDVSGSMMAKNLTLAKEAALEWISMMDINTSECAITTFDSQSYLNLDFSRDKNLLIHTINTLKAQGGTNYTPAFLDTLTGAIKIASKGTYKQAIIFLTDGQPNMTPDVLSIVFECNNRNISVYAVTLGLECPQSLKDIAARTGGAYFEKINTIEQIIEAYRMIFVMSRGAQPCEIKWISGGCDVLKTVDAKIPKYALTGTELYGIDGLSLARLQISPSPQLAFGKIAPGNSDERDIIIKALNFDVNVETIYNSNVGEFTIVEYGGVPPPFKLMKDQSRKLRIKFTPKDTIYTYSLFTVKSDACMNTKFSGTGGSHIIPPDFRTLKVLHPNGGEVFVAGSNDSVTWNGISPLDTVQIEFSSDSGSNWEIITSLGCDLMNKWKIPGITSSKCLIKAKQFMSAADNWRLLGKHDDIATAAIWHPGLGLIASAGRDKVIKIWSEGSLEPIKVLKGYPSPIKTISWSPDGSYIAGSGGDTMYYVWDFKTGNIIQNLSGHINGVNFLSFSPDGRYLLSAGNGGKLIIRETTDWKTISEPNLSTVDFRIAKWSPNGRYILIVTYPNESWVYDLQNAKLYKYPPYSKTNPTIDWNPSGNLFLTGTVIFDFVGNTEPLSLETELSEEVDKTVWSPDGSKIAGTTGASIYIWDAVKRQKLRVIRGIGGNGTSICWSPDSKKLVLTYSSGNVCIWNIYDTMQEDESDSLWSIVKPQAAARDIDMGISRTGDAKDSVITNYITNIGTYKIKIEKIYFSRKDILSYSIISGLPPFEIQPGESRNVEIRFRPKISGLNADEIIIVTQSDTLKYNIQGTGFEDSLKLASFDYNFGKIKLDSAAQATKILLKYSGLSSLKIDSIALIGPDMEQYTILSPLTPFVLSAADSAKELELQFKPKRLGRTFSRIAFYFTYPTAPYYAELSGEGVLPCSDYSPNYSNFQSIENLKFLGT
ncbi:MAG: hypothetical protein QG635_445, partial [Bacteroidota bacterium]|nr:hypothetical protein [Bacteroidota bacterium]